MSVLMPCRALEAFRLKMAGGRDSLRRIAVLMPCRALEAFRPIEDDNGGKLVIQLSS